MLRPANFLLSVLWILASSSTATGKGQEFVWLPSQIKASLARDDEYLHLGQYLLLEQELPTGTYGWTTMKIDLPESWQLDEISVRATSVHLVTKDSGSYELTGKNVVPLSSAILGDSTQLIQSFSECGGAMRQLGANYSFKGNSHRTDVCPLNSGVRRRGELAWRC